MNLDDAIEREARRFRRREEFRQILEDAKAVSVSDATLLANVRRYEKTHGLFIWSTIETIRRQARRDLREKELDSRRSRRRRR